MVAVWPHCYGQRGSANTHPPQVSKTHRIRAPRMPILAPPFVEQDDALSPNFY